jgi:hypothetical protein
MIIISDFHALVERFGQIAFIGTFRTRPRRDMAAQPTNALRHAVFAGREPAEEPSSRPPRKQ